MTMLAEQVDVVIGVDTHKHTHTAAAIASSTGAALAHTTVTADAAGDWAFHCHNLYHGEAGMMIEMRYRR